MWGDLPAKSPHYKLDRLAKACGAEWHAILIDRFKGPQIRDRFAPIIEALVKQKRYYEVVIATLVLNVLEFPPSIDLLLSLCGQPVLEPDFKQDVSVREVLDASREARKLIFEQIQTERLHYPFRVATNISEFYDAFTASLNPAERQEIGRAAKHVLGRINELPKDRQDQRYVAECRKAMKHVVELSQIS